jgi:hypothetical protein
MPDQNVTPDTSTTLVRACVGANAAMLVHFTPATAAAVVADLLRLGCVIFGTHGGHIPLDHTFVVGVW